MHERPLERTEPGVAMVSMITMITIITMVLATEAQNLGDGIGVGLALTALR